MNRSLKKRFIDGEVLILRSRDLCCFFVPNEAETDEEELLLKLLLRRVVPLPTDIVFVACCGGLYAC